MKEVPIITTCDEGVNTLLISSASERVLRANTFFKSLPGTVSFRGLSIKKNKNK